MVGTSSLNDLGHQEARFSKGLGEIVKIPNPARQDPSSAETTSVSFQKMGFGSIFKSSLKI